MLNNNLLKLMKYAIYALVTISLVFLLIFLVIHFSYKPVISAFIYHKANRICYESNFQDCKQALNKVISFDPKYNYANKAHFRIQHYLCKQDNFPQRVIDDTNAAYQDFEAKDYQKALKEFEKLKSEYPGFEIPYLYIAEIRYINKDYELSIDILNQGLKINKDYYDFYHYLGKNYFELGKNDLDNKDYKKAEKFYKIALENFKKIDNEINTFDCLPEHLSDTKDYIDFIDSKSRQHNR